MENLAKCKGESCEVKDTCNRFTAPANEYYQNYIKLPVIDGKCEMYWSIAVAKNDGVPSKIIVLDLAKGTLVSSICTQAEERRKLEQKSKIMRTFIFIWLQNLIIRNFD